MNPFPYTAAAALAFHLLLETAIIVRVLLRPHRQPASRIAWVVVVLALPVAGILAYLFFGEVKIGRRRTSRLRAVLREMSGYQSLTVPAGTGVPECHAHLFRVGRSISGFSPAGGNRGRLLGDSRAVIDALVADIDQARASVNLLFYIWLPDESGRRVAEALMRAARHGVTCRALADDLGSRALIHSPLWDEMEAAGVRLAVALPIGNPLLRPLRGRIDLRNHRKIVVIDGRITYCGSQNCADAEFRIKPKYAPWVDAMVRFEGPVAAQNQFLFASDWLIHGDETPEALLPPPPPPFPGGFPAQVFGTGPTVRYPAMPAMFGALMHAARRELVITTPYYVPDETIQNALCAAAYRGVATTLIVPARNDSRVVAAASRSYYPELLRAGVNIYEYQGGLLHTKSLVLDGAVSLIGSANLDRRSFELNYENNILFHDPTLAAAIRQRQQTYIQRSRQITASEVDAWPMSRRLLNNTIAMLGPLL